jgi:diguanylate cyclase (GGDEF)-like protein
MDLLADKQLPVKLLVECLNSDPPDDPDECQQEWERLEEAHGPNLYRDLLYLLTNLEFEPDEAREQWDRILAHRAKLRRTLQRDPGLQVAVADYFTNINFHYRDFVLVNVHRLLAKERSALLDDLTGLYNRRFFNQALAREVAQAERCGLGFALMVLDLDHFKIYNDTFGHQAGDKALVETARILTSISRTEDHVVRYGGEEFVVLLPRTDREQAYLAAERYRQAVRDHYFSGQEQCPDGNLTATVGLATFPHDARDGLTLFQKADEALYRGKAGGRNMVACWASEKRAHPRFPAALDMFLHYPGQEQSTAGPFRVKDISLSGIGCQAPQAEEMGQAVEVILRPLTDGPELQLDAHVVRVIRQNRNRFLLGLEFQPSDQNTQSALADLVGSQVALLH